MNDMFRNLTMVLAGGLCLGGCALPTDPPAAETFGAALDSVQHVNAGPGDKPKDSEPAKKDKEAAEDANIEKRIRAMAHYAAGVAHRERGELKEATEEFYQAALADPSDKKVVTEVIQMLLVTRQQAKIFQLLVQATKDPNATAELHALLAAAYLERKKPDMAKLAAENAIRRDPKAIEGYKSLVQAQRALHKEAGKRKKAIRSTIDRALKQTKTSVPFQVDLAMMLLGYLDLDKDADKELKPKATKLLESAWDSKPKEPLVLERIARGFRLAGAPDKAALAMEADTRTRKMPTRWTQWSKYASHKGGKWRAIPPSANRADAPATAPSPTKRILTISMQRKPCVNRNAGKAGTPESARAAVALAMEATRTRRTISTRQ